MNSPRATRPDSIGWRAARRLNVPQLLMYVVPSSFVDPELVSDGRQLLLRVVAMLTAMVLRLNGGLESGSGSGSGSEM